MDSLFLPGLQGFLLGASLIIAIGAQNAFVLRQGLLRRHVFAVSTICFLSDALLIAAGVAGLGSVIQAMPDTLRYITVGGALFLSVYGLLAFRRALHPSQMQASEAKAGGLAAAIVTCLGLTFLNPHVYLDTVVLLGGLSGRFAGEARLAFGLGAAVASAVWFYGLGYGSRLLQPLFARPIAWRVLDFAIAAIMWLIAASLLAQAIGA
ncbi:amino acid transporter [Oleomonas cavernae]|uniref:Amino acid transporter n=1 Tax=Oleomonas cavernae TaxID=2320859 RepID=A0A418WG59_9PROT|nr:LysE/ArgO family amino acid transporter [Oleomonas cavernae]RJF88988.1 amino acid transporter [Oleomonas cavernae]